MLSFWNAQLTKLDELIIAASPTQTEWGALIPTDIRPAAGKIKVAALFHLSQSCGLWGGAWARQLLFGFPLVGRLSQGGCFPVKSKAVAKKPENLENLMRPAPSRFEEKPPRIWVQKCPTSSGRSFRANQKRLAASTFPFDLMRLTVKAALSKPEHSFSVRIGSRRKAERLWRSSSR